MRKTHKKLLGFAGLGLVVATTAVAVTMPSPNVDAMSSITDVIRVYIPHDDPEITVEGDTEREITSPSYSFHVTYENVYNIRAVIINNNDNDITVYSEELWNTDPDWEFGEKSFDLNLDNYGGYGNYMIKVIGLGEGSVPVERILMFRYVAQPDQEDAGESGKVDVDVDIPQERIVDTTIDVYDTSGNLVKTETIHLPNGNENIDLGDLPDGEYTLKLTYKDGGGGILGTDTKTVVVDKDGADASIEVPIEDQGQDLGIVIINVKDAEGNTVKQVIVNDPVPGTNTFVPLPDNLPAGKYTVTTTYFDTNIHQINSTTSTFTKTGYDGKADIEMPTNKDTVTNAEIYIYGENNEVVRILKADRTTGVVSVYDKDGNPLFDIANGFVGDKITISMEGLESGNYIGVITFKNAEGRQIGFSKTIKIKYDAGGAIIVPDTGGFFQDLNISREDYLITGLIVFMVIGVVAFGIVARNRHNKVSHSKRNRR